MGEMLYFLFTMSSVLVFGAALISIAGYFVPSIIAGARGHESTILIVLLNLFLGWTFFGWVIALIWSMTGKSGKASQVQETRAGEAKMVKCNHCDELIDRRVVTCYFCHEEQWLKEEKDESKASKIAKSLTSI